MVHALASVGSVNLVGLPVGLKTEVDPDNNYRWIQWFIHEIRFNSGALQPNDLFGIEVVLLYL